MRKIVTIMAMIAALLLPFAVSAASDSISAPNISVTSKEGSATFTLKSDTSGVTIYYTTDGSDPDNKDKKYSSKVTLKSTAEVRAVAYDSKNKEYSDVGYYLVTVTQQRVGTPTMTAKEVAGGKTITIKSSTSGATIYYTTDGSTPTTSSKKYTSAFTVEESTYIRAIAVKSGYANSVIGAANVSITQLSKPTITVATSSGEKKVTLKAATGTTIYYTTNGSTPTTKSTKYSKPFTVSKACTVKAIAVKNGSQNSDVAEKDVTASPVGDISYTQTAVAGGTLIKLSTATSSATIYYTLDGSDPEAYGKKYTSSGIEITEAGTTKVRAIATKSGYENSDEFSKSFTLSKAAAPKVSLVTSTSGSRQVKITATSGATIYYTTNGTTPTTKSKKYSSPISVTSAMTIKAIAVRSGYAVSDVSGGTVTAGAAAAPKKSSETDILGGKCVKLTSATSGATIYYTLDGSQPDTSSKKYTSSGIDITEAGTTEILAIAVKSGYSDSDVASIPIKITRADTPTGTYSVTTSGYKVTLDAGSGATIYYTVDGTTPTTKSKKYSSAFTITETTTVRAIALKKGYATSNVFSGKIEVEELQVEKPTFKQTVYSTYNRVTITSATSGARIYYTTDGSDPSVYGKSLTNGSYVKITEDCQLRAIATKSGYKDSAVASFYVVVGEDDNTSYLSVDPKDAERVLSPEIPIKEDKSFLKF